MLSSRPNQCMWIPQIPRRVLTTKWRLIIEVNVAISAATLLTNLKMDTRPRRSCRCRKVICFNSALTWSRRSRISTVKTSFIVYRVDCRARTRLTNNLTQVSSSLRLQLWIYARLTLVGFYYRSGAVINSIKKKIRRAQLWTLPCSCRTLTSRYEPFHRWSWFRRHSVDYFSESNSRQVTAVRIKRSHLLFHPVDLSLSIARSASYHLCHRILFCRRRLPLEFGCGMLKI